MQHPDRDKIEGAFAFKLARLTGRQRRRLRVLMGSPPNPANVPASFWDEVRRENEETLATLLYLVYSDNARFHAAAGNRVLGVDATQLQIGRLDQQAEQWARNRAAEKATAITAATRQKFVDKMVDLKTKQDAGEKITRTEFDDTLGDVFSTKKSGGVATSETTVAQSEGGDAGIEATVGISLDDLWINRPGLSRTGPCPICKPLHRTRREVWELQFPGGPPAHDYCVCEIQYSNLNK